MAQFYTIRCPECGKEFGIVKGVFQSWDFSKLIPADLREETPFNCPFCKKSMCVLDENFRDNVVDVLFGD